MQEYHYNAYDELNTQKRAKVIVTLFTITLFLLGMMFIQDPDRWDFIGYLILAAAVYSFFSPYSYFNILGRKTFLNLYIDIDDKEIRYKLGPFQRPTNFARSSLKAIEDDGNDITFVLKDDSKEFLDMRKIFQVHKRTELILWITQFQKLSRAY